MTRRTSSAVSLALFAIAAGGCAVYSGSGSFDDPLPMSDALAELSAAVVPVRLRANGGTAVWVGADRYVTARHVFDQTFYDRNFEIGGQQYVFANDLTVGETTTHAEVVSAGAAEERAIGDWAVFDVVGTPVRYEVAPPVLDPTRHVAPGQEVVLIGYPTTAEHWQTGSPIDITLLRSRVVKPFFGYPGSPEQILCVQWDKGGYEGMSGGAAAVWDEHVERYVVIGILRGTVGAWSLLGLRFDALTVCRIPPAALAVAADAPPDIVTSNGQTWNVH